MNKEIKNTHFLLKHNLIFSAIAIIINAIFFNIIPNAETTFLKYGILINGFILIFFYINLFSLIRKQNTEIKDELLYTNYPIRIFCFFLVFLSMLIYNIITIYKINENAVDIIFISNLFINTITLHLPLIILFIFIFLVSPAIIIPNYDYTKPKKANIILIILSIILSCFLCFELIKAIIPDKITNNKTKYNLEKISYEYNNKFLTFNDINEDSKEELKEDKASFPFSYTKKEYIAFSYKEAEKYCKSLNADVASISEIYNMLFHEFRLRGENTYWTRNKVGRTPLLFHFKDLNYEVNKLDKITSANVVCTTNQNVKHLIIDADYEKEKELLNANIDKTNINIDTTKIDSEQKDIDNTSIDIPAEFVGFDIKFVTESYFNKMVEKGYLYQKGIKLNKNNLVATNYNIKQNENSKVNTCHFPFIKYVNFSLEQEKEIWKQNFCSPNFELTNAPIIEKTQYEKDTYCLAYGGRLPNIAELFGIIKSSNNLPLNKKYWVINTVEENGAKKHIYISDLKQIEKTAQMAQGNDTADVICIKNDKNSSNIITNFSSKFANENGLFYAKKKCPNCDYYEMPDMVLEQ